MAGKSFQTCRLTHSKEYRLCVSLPPCEFFWQTHQALYLLGKHGNQVPEAHLRSCCIQQPVLSRLFDRIDIHIEVPRVDYDKLSERRLGETGRLRRLAPSGRCTHRRVAGVEDTPARRTQRQLFSGVQAADGEVSPVICNADIAPALSTTGRGAQIL